ncbi:sialidase family protein [Nocardia sp. NPDC051570]|uniref:sialidase family protein n=1 Tax=Nocardia sp. NPDC051570 TaxID=3364324 RepID=UPI0037BD42A0
MRRIGVLLAAALCVLAPGVSLPAAGAAERQLLYPGSGYYPRLIRLAHNGEDNGTIVASVNTLEQTGKILISTDAGETFTERATIVDPLAADGGQLCCSSLYELPTAVGDLPAGTLLWADTTFHDDALEVYRRAEQKLWASSDLGATWHYVSTIATASTTINLTGRGPQLPSAWEPSLSMAADGQLVAFYSDETDTFQHSQKLMQVRTPDAVNWVNRSETVVSDAWPVRPGMANAVRLPDGSYLLTYEICNSDKVHQCLAYFRRSADGWNFGDPRFLGAAVRTGPDGGYTQHAPFPAWSRGPGPGGSILLSGQIVSAVDGSPEPGNGKVILADDDPGVGAWYEIAAPVQVPDAADNPCPNYSSALLPSVDGRSLLEAATDFDGTVCRVYYATGPLRSAPAATDN